jgi:hypothetical protein
MRAQRHPQIAKAARPAMIGEIVSLLGAAIMNSITVSHEQAKEIFKAINGIDELLKRLPTKPEDAPVKYAIMSNLTVIQTNLMGMLQASSN